MLYALSRVVGDIIQPSSLILVVLVGAMLSLVIRPTRIGRYCLVICILLLAACAWTPAANWMISPLEGRFPRQPLPQDITGIVVLGGAFDVHESDSHNMVAFNYRAERMTAFAGLARRYPRASLIFTGGRADLTNSGSTEAALAKRLFLDLGIPLDRVTFEDQSRNTRENALFTRRLVHLRPSDTWLLVTSAADMPRAVGSFRAIGWNVTPVSVDFHSRRSTWPMPGLIDGLREIDWSAHEWVGLVYYYIRGWTPKLFPKP